MSHGHYRMFGSSMDLRTNENGEYEVAKGVAAPLFKAVLVCQSTLPPVHTNAHHNATRTGILQEWSDHMSSVGITAGIEGGV